MRYVLCHIWFPDYNRYLITQILNVKKNEVFLFFISKEVLKGVIVDRQEGLEDTKEVIRIRKSKRNSQHNGQKTKDKKIYSVFQRTKSSMYTFFPLIHHLPLCVHDCDFVVILIHEWFRASNYAKASLVKPLLNEYLIKHQENKTGSKSRYFKWVWWL